MYGQEQLSMITTKAIEQIDELLSVLGVELRREKRMYVGACPIHGGDRNNAINLFHTGDTIVGNWKCRSHQCEKTFQPTLVGFVRGVLSHNNYGWEHPRDAVCPFEEAVSFLLNFLDQKYDDLKVDFSKVDKVRTADHVTRFYARQVNIKTKVPRSLVRQSIKVPTYYLNRGYSAEILDKYDVTFCDDPSKPMYKRCVAPIYEDSHEFMIGCTGRSIYEKCDTCSSYHNPHGPCPMKEDQWKYSKWKHSYGFAAEDWLYNYWYAREHIYKTKCAVLVESPGNVWRLEEAGIRTSLGLFNTSLTTGQLDALNSSGAINVVIALDDDDAGKLGIDPLIEELSKLYNIEVLEVNGDIGEMPVSQLQREVVPQIMKAYLE